MFKFSSDDAEQAKAYALLGYLTNLLAKQGTFTGEDGSEVKISDHVYVVGGAVRNFVMGQPVKDLDIVVDAISLSSDGKTRSAKWLAELILLDAPSGAKIVHVSNITRNDFGVEILRVSGDWLINGVNVKNEDIEIAFARKETYGFEGFKPEEVKETSIEQDSLRREFTFNTLLWSFSGLKEKGPSKEIIIDPLGTGLRDLENNIMDTPLSPEQTFEDDASRIMRVMKFKFKYGFDVAPRVQAAIENNPEFIRKVPTENLYKLLTQTVLNQGSYLLALDEMRQNGLLKELLILIEEDPSFKTSLKNWIYKERDLNYLFDILSYGFPFDGKISFLSAEDRVTLLKNVKSMSKESQDTYLLGLKSPGSLISDKTFFINLYKKMKEVVPDISVPAFNLDYYLPEAQNIILTTPEISFDSKALMEQIETTIMTKINDPMIAEAKKINLRLNKLAKFLSTENKGDLSSQILRLKSANIGAREKILSMVPNANGNVFIFDMDDTLFWTPDWFDEVSLDESGTATGVSDRYPMVFGKAIRLVSDMNIRPETCLRKDKHGVVDEDMLAAFKEISPLSLRKKITDIPALGKKDQTVFVLVDARGGEVSIASFKEFFPSKHQRVFDMRAKYYPNSVIVSGDPNFYKVPETLGTVPNEEVTKIYQQHASNAYVLTAREQAPGMSEGVNARLESVGLPIPLDVFTRPAGMSGSEYKGYVIGEIAAQPSVVSITFYDDNKRYINGVRRILEETYPDFSHKVTLNKVSIENKP
jgi:tRNA nucleotidyltransferase/poly(A) polymerase